MITATLSPEKLTQFFSQAQPFHFKKGQILLRPDDKAKDVYYIEKGYVRVYSLTEWGSEKLFIIYKTGELFPLFWLFDAIPLVRFYEALDDVQVRKVAKDEFLTFIKSDPDVLFDLTSRIVATFDVIINRIDNLEYANAYTRLIARLLYLAKRFGEKQGTKILINAPLTHKDIASSIALTRETTSREFEKLQNKGIVTYANRLIVINDIEILKKEISIHHDKKLM